MLFVHHHRAPDHIEYVASQGHVVRAGVLAFADRGHTGSEQARRVRHGTNHGNVGGQILFDH